MPTRSSPPASAMAVIRSAMARPPVLGSTLSPNFTDCAMVLLLFGPPAAAPGRAGDAGTSAVRPTNGPQPAADRSHENIREAERARLSAPVTCLRSRRDPRDAGGTPAGAARGT